MKLITHRDVLRLTPSRFHHQYEGYPSTFRLIDGTNPHEITKQLESLDCETSTREDIVRIIGSDWTQLTCDDCKATMWDGVEFGSEPDYESNTAVLCFDCVRKAMEIVNVTRLSLPIERPASDPEA